MKDLIFFAVVALGGIYLWKRLTRVPNQAEDVETEVALKNELGDAKRAAVGAAEIPVLTVGDMPFAGTPQTVFQTDFVRGAKPLVLFPKGQHRNPYTDILL